MSLDKSVFEAKRCEIGCCSPETTMLEAAKTLNERDISTLVVVDSEGWLLGVVTRTDVVRAALNLPDWEKEPVGNHIVGDVVTVSTEDTLEHVAKLLLHEHIHRVVVAEDIEGKKRPIAVVSYRDILFYLVPHGRADWVAS